MLAKDTQPTKTTSLALIDTTCPIHYLLKLRSKTPPTASGSGFSALNPLHIGSSMLHSPASPRFFQPLLTNSVTAVLPDPALPSCPVSLLHPGGSVNARCISHHLRPAFLRSINPWRPQTLSRAVGPTETALALSKSAGSTTVGATLALARTFDREDLCNQPPRHSCTLFVEGSTPRI